MVVLDHNTRNRGRYQSEEGFGIGDDIHSLSYDGCRQLLWHAQRHRSHRQPKWKPGTAAVGLTPRSHDLLLFDTFAANACLVGEYPCPLLLPHHLPWHIGDVLGVFLDIDRRRVNFATNGETLAWLSRLVTSISHVCAVIL